MPTLQINGVDEARLAILRRTVQSLDAAKHGERAGIVANAAEQLGCSRQSVYDSLRTLGHCSDRRRRANAGTSRLTDDEARAVGTIIAAAYRENNKRLMSIGDAMMHARANGLLQADVSATTLARRMRELNIHPKQAERAPAHLRLKSSHPNHVWQVDPSLCVLYRMKDGRVGVARADDELVYKNKLDNLRALDKRAKVWRYVQWDHYSSAFFFRYYETPGESAEVLLDFLLDAAAEKPGLLMHGWPDLLLWDKGSANCSAPVKNVLDQLAVRHETHKAHNARAKGGVEHCNNLIETRFESQLAFAEIPSVDELNRRADAWQADFNSMFTVRRTSHTRYGLWQMIRAEQLRRSPPPEQLRLLAMSAPVDRKVTGELTVAYEGRTFDVKPIDCLSAGDAVRVTRNAFDRDKVFVLVRDAQGIDRYHLCEPVVFDAAGFPSDAVLIGEEYRALADRPVDVARKDLREGAWGTRDENEARDARRHGRIAMGGRIDPFKAVEDRKAQLPQFVRRHSSELTIPNPVEIELKPLTHIAASKALRAMLGRALSPADAAHIREWFPDGVPETELDALAQRLIAPPPAPENERPRLSIVGGTSA